MAARLVQGQVARLNICADSELASNVPLVGRYDDPSRVMSKADLMEAFRWDAGVIKNEMAEAKDLVPSGVCGQGGDKCKPMRPKEPRVGDKWATSGRHVGDKCKLMRPKAPRVGDKGETSVNS